MPSRPFEGHVVVLTGASRGIGRAMARQLAACGARLALAARDRGALETVAEECRQAAGRAIAIPTDVRSEAACGELVERAVAAYGRLDALVANAGISMVARFEELESVEPLEQVMAVNYLGAVYCTRFALPHLLDSRGRLVAVSSLTGLTGVPTRTGYAASKHAMAGFFDSLRIELRGRGVSVTVAYPGFVDTGIRERAAGGGAGRAGGRAGGRIMTSEECARRILDAGWRRRRQVVMTARGKAGRWIKLLAPRLVDRIAARAVGLE